MHTVSERLGTIEPLPMSENWALMEFSSYHVKVNLLIIGKKHN